MKQIDDTVLSVYFYWRGFRQIILRESIWSQDKITILRYTLPRPVPLETNMDIKLGHFGNKLRNNQIDFLGGVDVQMGTEPFQVNL